MKLARRALEISADCADAYVILAEDVAHTLEDKRDLYAAGVAAGERALGQETFEADLGAFWGVIETRPYMRARAGLADCLWQLGERAQAVEHYRELLRLNPGDNQGIRYALLSWLMALDRDREAQRLIDEYGEEVSASWAYGRVLLAYRRDGGGQHARQLLAEAREINRFVPAYLTGQKALPKRIPELIGFGDASEAVACAAEQSEAWLMTSGAIEWVRSQTSQSRGTGKRTNRRVSITSRPGRDLDAERRGWLFPQATGSYDDIELAFLDPATPEDRALLVRAEHADFDRAIQEGRDEVVRNGHLVNRRLHLAMHEVVANQLWDGSPAEAWPTVERLRRLGYERHDILHMLGSVVTEELWNALETRRPNDPDKYARALAALPQSWLAEGSD